MNVQELRKRLSRQKSRVIVRAAQDAIRDTIQRFHDPSIHPELEELLRGCLVPFAAAGELRDVKPFTRFWKILGESEAHFQPGPVTDAMHSTWASLDVRLGGFGTLADIVWSLAALLQLSESQRETIDRLRRSFLSWQEVHALDPSNDHVVLRDLVTGHELTVFDPERSKNAIPGSLWLVRCATGPSGLGHCLTTPYVAGAEEKLAWSAYFARHKVSRSEDYERHMRNGRSPDYWLQYITDAYVNHDSFYFFVAGVPDRPETLGGSAPARPPAPDNARAQILDELIRGDDFGAAMDAAWKFIREQLADLSQAARLEFDSPPESIVGTFIGPAAVHAKLVDGTSAAERMLADRDREQMSVWESFAWNVIATVRFAVLEVQETEPGDRLRVKDLLNGRKFWIYDTRVSESARRGEHLAAWIMKDSNSYYFESDAYGLSEDLGKKVTAALRQLFREHGTKSDAREFYNKVSLVAAAMVLIGDFAAPTPDLRTTTGEGLQPCVAYFAVHDQAAVLEALGQLDGWHADSGAWVWLDEVNRTVLANAELDAKTLTVHCLARERLERAKTLLSKVCKAAITHRLDELETLDPNSTRLKPPGQR